MIGCLTLDGVFANPASRSHLYGWQAEEQVEEARGHVASLLNADPREIIWTSGATEANNLALKGAAEAYRVRHKNGGHIVISSIEHKAVLDPASWLETQGFRVTRIAPTNEGIITVDAMSAALEPDTFLASIMHVNNELGCINDIETLGNLCRSKGIMLHCDAAQSIGKISVDVKKLAVDLLSLSAHKFYGPKGIGALYVRRSPDVVIAAQIHGGGHERGMRSGTLATHQIVGMGEAARIAAERLDADLNRIAQLRDRLWAGLESLPRVRRNGSANQTVSGILNVVFGDIDGETLLLSLRELAVSSGSACNSANMSPSYVLKAIGLNDEAAQASLRFSIGRYTTADEIEFAIEHIRTVIAKLQRA